MDQQYYDHLLDYTRKNVSAKQTNAMRYANKMGKNVAPNALALFLRTPFTLSDQQLPLFFDSAFAAATQTRAGDIAASRALASEAELAAGAWLGELLDECGAVPRAAVSETSSQQLAVLAAPSLGSIYTHDNWVATDATNRLSVFQPNNLLALSTGGSTVGSSNFFMSRAQLREDMMRYRLGDALRAKSTLVVASNRLTLVHQNHAKWLDYLDTSSQALPSPAQGLVNTSFFFDALAATQKFSSFATRGLVLNDAAASSLDTQPHPALNTDLFEHYDIAPENIAVNTWLLFFNAERYARSTDTA